MNIKEGISLFSKIVSSLWAWFYPSEYLSCKATTFFQSIKHHGRQLDMVCSRS